MHRLFSFFPPFLLSVSAWSGSALHSGSFHVNPPLYEHKLQADADYLLRQRSIPETDALPHTPKQKKHGMTSLSVRWLQLDEESTLSAIICTTTPIADHDPLIQDYGLVKVPVFADHFPTESRHHFYRKDHSPEQGTLFLPYIASLDHRCTSFSTGDGDVAFLSSAENNYGPGCLATSQNRDVIIESFLTVSQLSDSYTVPGVLALGGGKNKSGGCCVSCFGRQTESDGDDDDNEQADQQPVGNGSDSNDGDGNDEKRPFSTYIKTLSVTDPKYSDKVAWAEFLEKLFGSSKQLIEYRHQEIASIFETFSLAPSSKLASWALQQQSALDSASASSDLGESFYEQWLTILSLANNHIGESPTLATIMIESLVAHPTMPATIRLQVRQVLKLDTDAADNEKKKRSSSSEDKGDAPAEDIDSALTEGKDDTPKEDEGSPREDRTPSLNSLDSQGRPIKVISL